METFGVSVAWQSVWQPGRFDRQFGPSFETSQHSCPLLQSTPHCSEIWRKAVFNNKPFQGKAWYFCYLVLCLAPRNGQPGGTSDMGLVTQTGHRCLSSQNIAHLDSRRNSHSGWKCEHTGVVWTMYLSLRSTLPPAGEVLFPKLTWALMRKKKPQYTACSCGNSCHLKEVTFSFSKIMCIFILISIWYNKRFWRDF